MIKNVNYNGRWVSVEFSKDEIEKIKQASLEENTKIAIAIEHEFGDKLSNESIAVIVQNATQHWVYKIEAEAMKEAKNMSTKDE